MRVLEEDPAGHAQQHRVDRGDRRDRRHPHHRPLHDDLDVREAVAHDGAREGQRDQAQRDRRQLHRQRRGDAQRVGQRVAGRERQAAERRAPRDPAQLAPRRHRPHLPERPRDDEQRACHVHRQVERLEPVQRLDDAVDVERLVVRGAGDREDAGRAEQQRGQVDGRPEAAAERRADPGPRPLREEQREVQQQRRQQQHRSRVGPVEHPVEEIQAPAEREHRPAEERARQPEEVQRRRLVRPAQPDRRPDQEREQADRREEVVEAGVAAGQRRKTEIEGLRRPEAKHTVGDRLPFVGAPQQLHDVGRPLDEDLVDRLEQVARPDARARGRRAGRDVECRHPFQLAHPQHSVVGLVPGGPDRDIRKAEHEQGPDDGDRRQGRHDRRPSWPPPAEPWLGDCPEVLVHRRWVESGVRGRRDSKRHTTAMLRTLGHNSRAIRHLPALRRRLTLRRSNRMDAPSKLSYHFRRYRWTSRASWDQPTALLVLARRAPTCSAVWGPPR